MAKKKAILVFARFPRKGKVKTRLAEALGDQRTLDVYKAMLFDSLEVYAKLPVQRRYLYIAGGNAADTEKLLDGEGLSGTYEIRIQEGEGLGERMLRALESGLSEVDQCLFLGVDSPTLPPAYICRGLSVLDVSPAVLGPSRDGGYYLLGLSTLLRSVFEGIPWGTSQVFAATRKRLGAREFVCLPRWYDLDKLEELPLITRELRLRGGKTCPRLSRAMGLSEGHDEAIRGRRTSENESILYRQEEHLRLHTFCLV